MKYTLEELVDEYHDWAMKQEVEIKDSPRNVITFLLKAGYVRKSGDTDSR